VYIRKLCHRGPGRDIDSRTHLLLLKDSASPLPRVASGAADHSPSARPRPIVGLHGLHTVANSILPYRFGTNVSAEPHPKFTALCLQAPPSSSTISSRWSGSMNNVRVTLCYREPQNATRSAGHARPIRPHAACTDIVLQGDNTTLSYREAP
jgi:hypothetical protein